MNNKSSIFLILCITALFTITSCNIKSTKNTQINLSDTQNLAISDNWAIINTAYAAFRTSYDENSKIEAPGRLGDIYCVKGHHIAQNGDNWYQFDNGWLPSTVVIIFDNKLQAEFAAKNIKN